jgi:ABC-type lipoprotein export system ATPase subunit
LTTILVQLAIALGLSIIGAGITTFVPELILKSVSDNHSTTYVLAGYLGLLALAPLLRLAVEVLSQKFAETLFNLQRVHAISKLRQGDARGDLIFSQAAFIIKDAYKILLIEIPAAICLISMVIWYSLDTSSIYQSAVLFSIGWGLLTLGFSIWLSKLQNLNLSTTDEVPVRLFREFKKSVNTYKYGKLSSEFFQIFRKEIQATSKVFVRFIFGVTAPGALSQFGLIACFLVTGFYFWQSGEDYKELFPLYFQINSITITFITLAGQFPTLRGFIEFKSKLKSEPYQDDEKYIFTSNKNGISISTGLATVNLLYGHVYQIHGVNGIGKSILLHKLTAHLERDRIDVIYINGSVDLASLHYTTLCSDGERQSANLHKCLELSPKVLLLDEATNSLDFSKQAEAEVMLSDLSKADALVIVIDHSYNHRKAIHFCLKGDGDNRYLQEQIKQVE